MGIIQSDWWTSCEHNVAQILFVENWASVTIFSSEKNQATSPKI